MKIKTDRIAKLIGRALILLSPVLFISACANIPDQIQSESVATLNTQSVRGQIEQYKGQTVRWGGVITQVINNADNTWIELLALNLNSSGRPSSNRENNYGRFIAKLDQFMDPEVYQEGNSFTVIGILTDEIGGKIGEHNYKFPVVSVQGSHLWPKRSIRYYPPIIPGYWYYGYHPYWRFGLSYYGFGVRKLHNYYPYYPLYGHLDRTLKSLPRHYRSDKFTPQKHTFWKRKSSELYTVLQQDLPQRNYIRRSENSNDPELVDGRHNKMRSVRPNKQNKQTYKRSSNTRTKIKRKVQHR